tara:strand:+ start:1613 stop:1828 length:216 start_codon:yes stop_codon:yes gene_type:complete
MSINIFYQLLNISSSAHNTRKFNEHIVRYLSPAETAVTLSSKEDAEEIYKASIAVEPKEEAEAETEHKAAM